MTMWSKFTLNQDENEIIFMQNLCSHFIDLPLQFAKYIFRNSPTVISKENVALKDN